MSFDPKAAPLSPAQRVVQAVLLFMAAVAIYGGTRHLLIGQAGVAPQVDNLVRYLAGAHVGHGLICLWVALRVRAHRELVVLLALVTFFGGIGRVMSINDVGWPEPASRWLGYVIFELTVPWLLIAAQWIASGRPHVLASFCTPRPDTGPA